MSEDAWNDLLNAESYAEFTRNWPVYPFLNGVLADALFSAHPSWPNLRILDLACGSGATTEAILRKLGPEGEIHCIDRAAAMVNIASRLIDDPRVTFEVCAAEQLKDRDGDIFDAILCNAAFWHFDGDPLAAIAKRLKPNGSFHFTVPATYVSGHRVEGHPLQAAMSRVLAEGYAEIPGSIRELDPDQLRTRASALGLDAGQWSRVVYESTQDEFMALLRIPAMSDWIAPGLGDAQRDALIDEALKDLDPRECVQVNWFVVQFRRLADDVPTG